MGQENARHWKATGWCVQAKDSREVLTMLSALGSHSVGQQFAWRGLPSTEFDLSSALHRRLGPQVTEEEVSAAETRLIQDARSWGLGNGSTTYVDDFKLLADLQHYGIETRLIDFSHNPLTALWFACQEPKNPVKEKSAILLALNVTSFERYTTVRDEKTWDDFGYGPSANLRRALGAGKPFRVDVAHPNERLQAQEGLFISGPVPGYGGLERSARNPFGFLGIEYKVGEPSRLRDILTKVRDRPGAPQNIPFAAIVVPPQVKRKLLSYLEGSFNKTASRLFPDFAGFREFQAHGGRGGDVEDVPGGGSGT